MKKKGPILGVDCGGTNIKLALVEPSGKILKTKLAPIDYKRPPESVIFEMADRVTDFLKECKAKKVSSVGFGIAGEVDQKNGIVRFSPNLGWNNVNLRKALAKKLDFDVLIDNDANCAAWGAWWLDAKKDCDHLVCLTLGTGVGGGVVIDRKLLRGATGSAAELGHMSIHYNGGACKCGSKGCIESMIGAWSLIRLGEEGLKAGSAPILKTIVENDPKKAVTPRLLAEAARAGDPYCIQLWKDAGEKLGCALVNYVQIFNPERIVLCGGVSKAGDLILVPALKVLKERAFKTPAEAVTVSVSKFDENLGVVGAALLSLEG